MTECNSFLQVERRELYDLVSQRNILDISLKISVHSIQKGIIKELGVGEYAVLSAIAGFMDNDGQGFPSQRKIAEITGLSLPTVNKLVNKLLTTEINGVPVLSRTFEVNDSTKRKFSVYTLQAPEQTTGETELKVIFQKGTEQEEVKPEPVVKKTAKDFAHRFKHRYEEAYGVKYIISYAKELSLIKNKLMKELEQEQIEELIDYIIDNYKDKWSKPMYQYPTISMMCGWLGNVALQELEQAKKKVEELTKIEEESLEYASDNYAGFDLI